MCSDASLILRRHLIESVISSCLANYWRKFSLQISLDRTSQGTGIKSPPLSEINLFQINFRFQVELDKVITHTLYCLYADQIRISDCWLLLVALFCRSIWVRRWKLSYMFAFSALNYISEPTMMQIRCVKTLLDMSSYFSTEEKPYW